jgi:hypothetical protein
MRMTRTPSMVVVPKVLKYTVLALVVTVSLLVAVGAVALVVGNATSSEADLPDIGVGPTDLLANGVLNPSLA